MATLLNVQNYYNTWQSNYSVHPNFKDTRDYFRQLIEEIAHVTHCAVNHYNVYSKLTNNAWGNFTIYISYEHLLDNTCRIKIVIGPRFRHLISIGSPWISSFPHTNARDLVWLFLNAKVNPGSIIITNCNHDDPPIYIELDGNNVNLEQIQPLCAIITNAINAINNLPH